MEATPYVAYAMHKPRGMLAAPQGDEPWARLWLPPEPEVQLSYSQQPFSFTSCEVWNCGRLDKDTSGLVIFTNDGWLSGTVLKQIEKEYLVETEEPLSNTQLRRVRIIPMVD